MFCSIHKIQVSVLLACAVFAVAVAAIPEEADARRFRMHFSAGRAAAPAARSAVRTRSAAEVAAEAHAESRIDWSHAAHMGLEVVKTGIESAMNNALSGSGSPPKSAYSNDTLSRLELEGCMRESSWLDDRQERYEAKKTQLDAQRAEINQLEAELDAARARVDRTSQRSVDAFNARLESYRQRVAHFNNVVVADAERDRHAFNGRIDKFNAYCDGKRYYADDLAAVEAKIGVGKTN